MKGAFRAIAWDDPERQLHLTRGAATIFGFLAQEALVQLDTKVSTDDVGVFFVYKRSGVQQDIFAEKFDRMIDQVLQAISSEKFSCNRIKITSILALFSPIVTLISTLQLKLQQPGSELLMKNFEYSL